ncbi:hypothetical protein R1flu_004947 [Riccia fluitans]|uniref:Uncharacterized protein n=1 Tax=Riccia fluitans TaxID=41844 RepID=A0ABD1YRR5_9MARC
MANQAVANQVMANPVETPPPAESGMLIAGELLGKVDDILLKGLESMLLERPLDPVEYMASYIMERHQKKKFPHISRQDHGPLPPTFSCGCVPGPLRPQTSCGCFLETGWEMPAVSVDVQQSAQVDFTSMQTVERMNAGALV